MVVLINFAGTIFEGGHPCLGTGNIQGHGSWNQTMRCHRGNYTPEEICSASDRIITDLIGPLPGTIYVASDSHPNSLARISILRRHTKVISYVGPYAEAVDMNLLIRAHYFVGNPASTFSTNVARVRHARGDLQTNIHLPCNQPGF